jgi:hypothetical protein
MKNMDTRSKFTFFKTFLSPVLILQIKIIITLLFWVVPLLFFPKSLFIILGFPPPEPIFFIRLLGLAYLSLLIAYEWARRQYKQGKKAEGILLTGIVSNGGVSFFILISGILGMFSSWGILSRIFIWISAAVTMLLALALVLCFFREKSTEDVSV